MTVTPLRNMSKRQQSNIRVSQFQLAISHAADIDGLTDQEYAAALANLLWSHHNRALNRECARDDDV